MELCKLKLLLGIPKGDSSQDTALQFVLDDTEETILNYCHMKKLPNGLYHTAYRMAVDLFRGEGVGSAAAPPTVSSISEGNTSTSFTSAADALDGGILKDYGRQLNRYRKLVW